MSVNVPYLWVKLKFFAFIIYLLDSRRRQPAG